MQQQTITCWMWPEWMIDDSVYVSPLTITQMREDSPWTPQRPVTVMSKPRPTNVTADLSGPSVYILYLHLAIDTLKIRSLIQKVHWMTLQHCRSDVRSSRWVNCRRSWDLRLKQALVSWTSEWRRLKRWPRVVLPRPRWWTTWCRWTISDIVETLARLSFFLPECRNAAWAFL